MSVECFKMLRILELEVLDVCEGVEMDQFCWKQTKTNKDRLTLPEPEEIWELCLLDLAVSSHSSAGTYDSHKGGGAHTSSVKVGEASLPVLHFIGSWPLHSRPLGTTQGVSSFPLTRRQLFSHLS